MRGPFVIMRVGLILSKMLALVCYVSCRTKVNVRCYRLTGEDVRERRRRSAGINKGIVCRLLQMQACASAAPQL